MKPGTDRPVEPQSFAVRRPAKAGIRCRGEAAPRPYDGRSRASVNLPGAEGANSGFRMIPAGPQAQGDRIFQIRDLKAIAGVGKNGASAPAADEHFPLKDPVVMP